MCVTNDVLNHNAGYLSMSSRDPHSGQTNLQNFLSREERKQLKDFANFDCPLLSHVIKTGTDIRLKKALKSVME